MLGDGLADIQQERSGPAGGVIDLDRFFVLQVIGDDLGHEHGNLVRRIELARLLPGIVGKLLLVHGGDVSS